MRSETTVPRHHNEPFVTSLFHFGINYSIDKKWARFFWYKMALFAPPELTLFLPSHQRAVLISAL